MPPPMTQQEAQLLAERYLQTVWRTTDQKIVPLPSEGENVFGFTLKITRVIKVEPDVMTIENLADEPVHVRVLARLIQRHGHTAWYAKLHKGVSGNYCVRLSDSRMFLLSTQEYPD